MRPYSKILIVCSLLTVCSANPLLSVAGQAGHDTHATPAAASKPSKPQTTCPVMGGPIDKNLYVDAKGKRIYLCCAGCEEAVRTEPEKYIKKIEQRGESVEDAPTTDSATPAPANDKARN